MSWREDCEAGLLYDNTHPEREAEHIACANLCWEHNRIKPTDTETREKLLWQILGKLGNDVYAQTQFDSVVHCL